MSNNSAFVRQNSITSASGRSSAATRDLDPIFEITPSTPADERTPSLPDVPRKTPSFSKEQQAAAATFIKKGHSSVVPTISPTIQEYEAPPAKTYPQPSPALDEFLFYSNPNSQTPSVLEQERKTDPFYVDDESDSDYGQRLLIPPPERKPISGVLNRPWFLYLMSLGQVIGLIYSLVLNYQYTGQVIQTNPFNPLIGPETGIVYLSCDLFTV